VTVSNDKFLVQLELPGFSPEDFSLKTRDDVIVLEAKHKAQAADGGTEFTARWANEMKRILLFSPCDVKISAVFARAGRPLRRLPPSACTC